MTPKLQNILHWFLVIALTVLSIEPAINGAVHDHLTGQELIDGIVGILIAAATKFVYYANTVKGTTIQMTSITSPEGSTATVMNSTTNVPENTSVTSIPTVSDPSSTGTPPTI